MLNFSNGKQRSVPLLANESESVNQALHTNVYKAIDNGEYPQIFGGDQKINVVLGQDSKDLLSKKSKVDINVIVKNLGVKMPWYHRYVFIRAAFLALFVMSLANFVFFPFAILLDLGRNLAVSYRIKLPLLRSGNIIKILFFFVAPLIRSIVVTAIKAFASALLHGFFIPFISLLGFCFPGTVGNKLTKLIVFPAVVGSEDSFARPEDAFVLEKDVDISASRLAHTQAEHWDIKPKNATAEKTIIYFCGNGYPFQLRENMTQLKDLVTGLKVNIRAFNYPVVSGAQKNNQNVTKEAIMEGILHVYDVCKDLNFDNEEDKQKIINNCRLYAHSTGGGIALHVAYYFQKYHDINLFVIVDRSFSSFAAAMGAQLNVLTGVFFAVTRRLSQLLLYAMGDNNVDNIAAYEKLNNKLQIDYFNAVEIEASNADQVILDDATFANGIASLDKCALSPADGQGVLQKLADSKSPHALLSKVPGSDCHAERLVEAWQMYDGNRYADKVGMFSKSNKEVNPLERLRETLLDESVTKNSPCSLPGLPS